MILSLRSNELTRFGKRNGYAFSEIVPQDEALSGLLAALLGWLSSNLAEGETLSDVVLEEAGSVAVDEENVRPCISAAVSVTAPAGSRTFVVSSEALPAELRDGLLAAWSAISES